MTPTKLTGRAIMPAFKVFVVSKKILTYQQTKIFRVTCTAALFVKFIPILFRITNRFMFYCYNPVYAGGINSLFFKSISLR